MTEDIAQLFREHIQSIDVHYLRKWLFISGLIGIVAGIGSIVFFSAIGWSTQLFLGRGAGFVPPAPLGEGHTVVTAISRRWMIPVVTTLGGLLSGLIVYTLAPEAEGHGTDAAIEAFHHKEGLIRARVPLIKLVASAITIGSGGSAGREGPTAQIAAGFGSLLGRLLNLSVQERRIAVAAGIGAGIGSIFKAPVGGALLSTEILYLNGFEIDALVPSFIASVIGYTIFASWSGYTPIFGSHFNVVFEDPTSLIYYAFLGLVCGVVGMLYPKLFYAVRDYFHHLGIPNVFKPAIGGLVVGLIGLFLPEVLGMGYGWLQMVMVPQTAIPLGLIVLLVFGKIVATSLSIGSGGSGGVFAPGLFIGGMLGAAMWTALYGRVGHVPASPEAFVVVGMMALFGGVARAPLAVMFMVGEMAGSYTMLAPAMIAVGISYVIIGRNTIYESQVESPAQSPAHRHEYSFPLLAQLRVKDAMRTDIVPVTDKDTAKEVERRLAFAHTSSLPVVDSQTHGLVGIVSKEDLLRLPERDGQEVAGFMTANVVTTTTEDSLSTVMELMSEHNVSGLPVLQGSGRDLHPVGLISRRDLERVYTRTARELLGENLPGGAPELVMEETMTPAQSVAVEGLQEVVPETKTLHDLLERIHKAGITARPLEITEVEAGLHERAEGIIARPIYLVSWAQQAVRLLGLGHIPGTEKGRGKYVKLSPERIELPPVIDEAYRQVYSVMEVHEGAVFLSTDLADSSLGLILAVRSGDHWLELHRWNASWTRIGISRPEICSV